MLKVALFLGVLAVALGSVTNLDQTNDAYVSPSSTAKLTLSSNPTTGYMWYMVPSNSVKLQIQNPQGEYQSQSGKIGGGGVQVFEVDCNELCQEGDELKLIFQKRRPWESEPVEEKHVTLHVVNQ
mmetsp:Transcript_10297/g.15385  ORF Transcript_10297/g.15385 Transcript_10297/m.15385 type:complete len:125 (-) Transcript_10297:39-413(-)